MQFTLFMLFFLAKAATRPATFCDSHLALGSSGSALWCGGGGGGGGKVGLEMKKKTNISQSTIPNWKKNSLYLLAHSLMLELDLLSTLPVLRFSSMVMQLDRIIEAAFEGHNILSHNNSRLGLLLN